MFLYITSILYRVSLHNLKQIIMSKYSGVYNNCITISKSHLKVSRT